MDSCILNSLEKVVRMAAFCILATKSGKRRRHEISTSLHVKNQRRDYDIYLDVSPKQGKEIISKVSYHCVKSNEKADGTPPSASPHPNG